MNIFSAKIKLLEKLKKKIFSFYRSKELKIFFNIMEKDEPKNSKIAMFVGGCVRKYINSEEIDDIDIATIFTPEKIKNKFKDTEVRVIETGIDHGSVTLLIKDHKLEVTTLRKDVNTDGRHAEVAFTDDWVEDSNRRDFTINAIYMDRKGNFFDPQLGIRDLKNRTVKFIGNPNKRIEEDYLRIIRFVRFTLQYNSEPDYSTFDAIKLNLDGIKNISKERIVNELNKIISLKNFKDINKNTELKNIFYLIFPELRYLERLKKLDLTKKLFKLNTDFILAFLLIDDSNNHEYFCHKYKTSNAFKKKLEVLSRYLKEYKLDKNFFKNNLKKNVYFLGKDNLKEFNTLIFFIYKEIKYNEYLKINQNIESITVPKFPYDGKYLKNKGLVEGIKIGSILKEIEIQWVRNNYSLEEKDLTDLIKKNNN